MNIVSELEHAGYQFTIYGDQIRYALAPGREPDPATVRPLLQALKEHKAEAITFLRQRDGRSLALDNADPEEISRARHQLRQRGYFVMHSRILGGQIAVAETEACRRRVPQGIPVYTLAEIRLLQQGIEAGTIWTVHDLKLLHEAKKRLGGGGGHVKEIEIRLPRSVVVLTVNEVLALLQERPDIWQEGLRRGKGLLRARQTEKRIKERMAEHGTHSDYR
jgi:hypothetical protein